MDLQRRFHMVYPVFVLPFFILCFFVLMELDLATGIPQDTASVYMHCFLTLIPRLCVFFSFSLLCCFSGIACFFYFLFSPMSPVVGLIQPLDTDRGLSRLMRTERRGKKDDQPLHPEVYPVNYKSVGEFTRRLDTTNIFLTRDCLLD